MRTLKLHFSEDALPTLDTFLKRTKEARIFRRTQAVRAVVTGQRLQTVSDTLHFTYSALRKWVHRFATQGTQGLVDRPRSGRPPKVTWPWNSTSTASSTKIPGAWLRYSQLELSRARHRLSPADGCPTRLQSGRGVLKKYAKLCRPTGRLDPTPADLAMAPSNWLPWSTGLAGATSFYSTKMKLSCGALPCPGWAGGAAPSAIVSHAATEPESNPTRKVVKTSRVAMLSLVEPDHQWRVAQRHWCRAVWDLACPL